MSFVVVSEYVWIGGKGELRSKVMVQRRKEAYTSVDQLPEWNYDGSSTAQAEGRYSEILIRPVAIFRNPFGVKSADQNLLVMCDAYNPDGTPVENNHRAWAKRVFDRALDEEPWFGLEQEYFLVDPETDYPVGFDQKTGSPPHLGFQGPYYCGVGAGRAFGRAVAEEHLEACLFAGVKISGINAEVAPGQWEFQIGPCLGIETGDHVYIARYMLWRIAEKHNIALNFEPKPIKGDWNGSGCHANFSTRRMREGDGERKGMDFIVEAIERLKPKHLEHMQVYGENNEERMSGKHETASYNDFSYGVANRGASIRIPTVAGRDGKGYFEDRRPAANVNPYLLSAKLFETSIGLKPE